MTEASVACVCVQYPLDARECYELRTYGYSPVLRDESDHSEGMFMLVDRDGTCECPCHDRNDEEEDDW